VRTLLFTTLAFLAGCGSAVERNLIYHPTRRLDATPSSVGLAFEEVRVTTEDGVALHGWHVEGPRGVTVLWCHGNAGNIGHRVENLRLLRERLGVSVVLFDYRGYGTSEGVPSETGLYRDARAVRTWLRQRAGAAPLVYFGRSLGAAVAARLADEEPPAALVLETPFTSVRAMANARLPGAGFLFRSRYDTLGVVSRIRAPLLVLHGDADEVVPFGQGRAVFEAAGEPKRFVRIPGAHHNDTYVVGGAAYWQAWEGFLASSIPGW
jgi:uncharacterized protein